SSQSGEGDIRNVTRALKPADMETVTYLPAESNLVAGLHVSDLMRQTQGQQLLRELKFGSLELGGDRIEKWTGLKWHDIDQLAFALKLDGLLIPRLTLVVQTVEPNRMESLLKRLHAVRIPEAARADYYRF